MSKTAEADSFIWKTAYEKYPDIEGASVSKLKRIENARDKFIVGAFWMREQSSSKDARIKELEARLETAEKLIRMAVEERSMCYSNPKLEQEYCKFITNKTE